MAAGMIVHCLEASDVLRHLCHVTAIVVLSIFVASCGGNEPGHPAGSRGSAPAKIRQAGFRVLYMWPIFLANDRGFFRDEGLDFEYIEVDSGLLGVAALVSGDAQIADMGANDVANLHNQGKDLILVRQLVRRMTMDLIFSTTVAKRLRLSRDIPLIARYSALKGLTIGITRPGAPTDVFIRYFLKQGGLNPDRDAILLPVGGAAPLASALRTGQIDAYLLSPPIPDSVGRVIISCSAGDVPELSDIPFVNLAVTRTYVETHADVVQAYVHGVKRSIAWGAGHRDEAIRLTGKYFPDIASDELARAWDELLPAMSTNGDFTEQGLRAYLQIMVEMGQLPQMPPTLEGVLWTNRFTRGDPTSAY
jgi:ABC-type nitrate/sulfonate/bicarbonate transport system substrate-binding protein